MLTDLDIRILEFERQWFRYTGARENAIVEAFDMSPTRYHQRLVALLDDAAAFEANPVLINRLRRVRDERRRRRSRAA